MGGVELMITVTQPGRVGRRDRRYHDERLRVTVHQQELNGHRVMRAGKFLLTGKMPDGMGKIILRFENCYAEESGGWEQVSANGVFKVPVTLEESKSYLEGCGYCLYLFRW